MEKIQEWVIKHVEPQISTPDGRVRLLQRTRRFGVPAGLANMPAVRSAEFKEVAQFARTDLARTDVDILNAMIFDFLGHHVFNPANALYNSALMQGRLQAILDVQAIMIANETIRERKSKVDLLKRTR